MDQIIARPLGKILVIIPTYNELDNINIAVAQVRDHCPHVDILVADDNSPDGTGNTADEIAKNDAQVQVLHRTAKEGLGAAYLAGFAWARANGYDVVVEMDADGSHRAQDLPGILEALKTADVVLGSRWIKGGRVVNWPLRRRLLSQGGNLYTRIMLGMPISDATGGFRALRMTSLEKMNLSDVASQGYCFQVDLAYRAVLAGLRVVEVPIVFLERERGQSKMDQAIVTEALKRVTLWGITKRKNQITALFGRGA
ncbi:MAG: polyprenol monophosphomannose synthase [Actinomycetes bacterium]